MRDALPRIAARVLRLALPVDWREDIVRDVEDAWLERRRRGRVGAWIWLWMQAVSFGLRFLPDRLADLGHALRFTSVDLRLALRSVRRSAGVTALAVVSLAFGIGLTTAAFVVIKGAFFTPLPLPDGERVVVVEDYNATRRHALTVDAAEYLRRRDRVTSFEALGAYWSRPVLAGTELGRGRRIMARYVTAEVLTLAGRAPLHGRLPDAADARPGAVAGRRDPVCSVGHGPGCRP